MKRKIIVTVLSVLFIILSFLAFNTNKTVNLNAKVNLYEPNSLIVESKASSETLNNINNTRKEIIKNDNATLSKNFEVSYTFLDVPKLEDKIKKEMKDITELSPGYKLSIDNNIFYLENKELFDNTMDKILSIAFPSIDSYNDYRISKKITPVYIGDRLLIDFVLDNEVKLTKELVPTNQKINNVNDLFFKLMYGNQEKKKILIQPGQSLESVQKNYNLSDYVLRMNNPNLNSKSLIYDGMEIGVNEINSILNLSFFYETQNIIPLPFAIEKVNSAELTVGSSKVNRYGSDGSQNVTYHIKETNNSVVNNVPIKYEVITQPVNEIVLVGQRVVSGLGSGTFGWPGSSRNITNGAGGLDALGIGHIAIDIQSWYGAPIFASDNGVVEFAGWQPIGGGWEVVINHNNGFKTKYSHMVSRPPISVGQHVERGQVIGREGASGLATGPHLHFEIIKNGRRVNPLYYL